MQELASDFGELKLLYPNLAQLSAIALTIPVSSVNCERDFSAMNRVFCFHFSASSLSRYPFVLCYVIIFQEIKTDLRNRLQGKSLTACL